MKIITVYLKRPQCCEKDTDFDGACAVHKTIDAASSDVSAKNSRMVAAYDKTPYMSRYPVDPRPKTEILLQGVLSVRTPDMTGDKTLQITYSTGEKSTATAHFVEGAYTHFTETEIKPRKLAQAYADLRKAKQVLPDMVHTLTGRDDREVYDGLIRDWAEIDPKIQDKIIKGLKEWDEGTNGTAPVHPGWSTEV